MRRLIYWWRRFQWLLQDYREFRAAQKPAYIAGQLHIWERDEPFDAIVCMHCRVPIADTNITQLCPGPPKEN